MRIYVSGRISGLAPYRVSQKFGYTATHLREQGHCVINPFTLCMELWGKDFKHEEYMQVCLAALGLCDCIYMMNDWEESIGAKIEHEYAKEHGMKIIYEPKELEI